MLTIGEFARTTGLSAKALRLYDDLGLLAPAEVDPRSGYRYYVPEQVDRARLIARLRSAGVPLPRITSIVEADTREIAAAELLSYWRQVEADTASARNIVGSLVAQMRGNDFTMNTTGITIRSAHRAGRGGRTSQLDALYPRDHRLAAQLTGQRLFAVADGFGTDDGVAGAAIDALADLDGAHPHHDPLDALDAAVSTAAGTITGRHHDDAGTTLTALLLLADRALLAHVGDSRAYLVRGRSVEQLTRDHTMVQALVDEGRLTDEEAWADPNRALLNRALGHPAASAPDLSVHAVESGDRFVLTTDGVHGVLEAQQLVDLLLATGGPDAVAGAVEDVVVSAGAPDNYAIVIVDL